MDEYNRRRRRSRAVMSMFLDSINGSIDNVDVATFDSDGTDLKALVVGIEPVQSGTGDPSPDNVRPITGRSSVNVIVSPTLNPLDGTITNIPLGTTVYGGQLDVLTGVLTVKYVAVDMGTLTYQLHSNTSSRQGWQIVGYGSIAAPASSVNDNIHAISSEFKSLSYNATWTPYIIAPQNNSGTGAVVTFPTNAYSTGGDVATALDGVQLVYELATPTAIQLTGQQIATFLGTNNVWCDSGKIIHLEY